MLSKRSTLVISGLALVVFILLERVGIFKACFYGFIDPNCSIPSLYLLGSLLIIALPIFIFALISYFLDIRIFKSWEKFTLIYLLIYLFIVIIGPENSGGGWLVSSRSTKATYAFLLTFLFAVISLIFIVIKSIQVYRKKK